MIQVNDTALADAHFPVMNVSFATEILSDELAPLAFPLIQATCPNVDMTSWQKFVRFFNVRASAGDGGVLAVRDAAACICGVLAYRVDRDLRTGPTLAVDLFTAADLANSLRPVRALLDAAEMWACKLGCVGVQIRISNDQVRLASRLHTLGFSSEAGLYLKAIDTAPSPN